MSSFLLRSDTSEAPAHSIRVFPLNLDSVFCAYSLKHQSLHHLSCYFKRGPDPDLPSFGVLQIWTVCSQAAFDSGNRGSLRVCCWFFLAWMTSGRFSPHCWRTVPPLSRLLFQMCLPAETTVLMFGGYEQIPSYILCYELWFWQWSSSAVFMGLRFECAALWVLEDFG